MDGTFNPNGYDRAKIAAALKKAYEGYARDDIDNLILQINGRIADQSSAIQTASHDVQELRDTLLSPVTSSSNLLSLSQEDLTIDGGSGDAVYLTTDGTISVTKGQTTKKLIANFGNVYIPKSVGNAGSYLFGVLGIPEGDEENIVCSIYVNEQLGVTTEPGKGDALLVPNIDVFGATFRIEITASKTVSNLVLKPYVISSNNDDWTDATWQPFFPSLTWLASLAKAREDHDKILFDGSDNLLYLNSDNLTVSSEDVYAELNHGKLIISNESTSAGSVTISGISLSAGRYTFGNIGDTNAGDGVLTSKLMDGSTEIVSGRHSFTLDTDKTNLSVVIEIAADSIFGDIVTLPFISKGIGGLSKYLWEPFYPSIMDIYRGLS